MAQTTSPGDTAGAGATEPAGHAKHHLPILVLGALGVVYGDIGTSPIYAFRQAMAVRPGAASTETEVLGLLSLIIWALTITVSAGLAAISERETFDNYLNAADQFLYMAKHAGRNRVFSELSLVSALAS